MAMSKKAKNDNITMSQLLKRIEILEEEVRCLSHTVSFLNGWRQDIVGKTTKELLDKEFYLGWHTPNQRVIENYESYVPNEATEDVEPLIDRFTKEENGTAKERSWEDYQRKSNEYECKQLSSLPDEKLNYDIDRFFEYLASPEHKEAEQREYEYWRNLHKDDISEIKELLSNVSKINNTEVKEIEK